MKGTIITIASIIGLAAVSTASVVSFFAKKPEAEVKVGNEAKLAVAEIAVEKAIISPSDIRTFSSDKLGIRFSYSQTSEKGNISTSEIGRRVYVFLASQKPEKGQWLEVFDKTDQSSLKDAIKQKILSQDSSKNCFAQPVSGLGFSGSFQTAVIPTDSSAGCPEYYSSSKGYFLYNPGVSKRFLFIHLSGKPLTVANAGTDQGWDTSIEIFKPSYKPKTIKKSPVR
ncbi:MAG: hypothetical protein ACM3KM_04235 [Acidobacteriaceae bacterium]